MWLGIDFGICNFSVILMWGWIFFVVRDSCFMFGDFFFLFVYVIK